MNKPFCGHCKKIGKSEKEYTSHWTRASAKPDAPVTCPEILKTECRYCHAIGHWASIDHCPALKLRKKEEEKKMKNQEKEKEQQDRNTKRGGGGSSFGLLLEQDSDSESEEEKEPMKPMKPMKPMAPLTPPLKSAKPTSSILKTVPSITVKTPEEVEMGTKSKTITFIKPVNVPKVLKVINGVEKLVYDWTYESDSDDSEDEEDC